MAKMLHHSSGGESPIPYHSPYRSATKTHRTPGQLRCLERGSRSKKNHQDPKTFNLLLLGDEDGENTRILRTRVRHGINLPAPHLNPARKGYAARALLLGRPEALQGIRTIPASWPP